MSSVQDDRNDLNNVTLCAYRPVAEQVKDSSLVINNSARLAVEVRRIKLSYGRGRNAKPILSEINLTVPEGAM